MLRRSIEFSADSFLTGACCIGSRETDKNDTVVTVA
jgi:hypothetical protein